MATRALPAILLLLLATHLTAGLFLNGPVEDFTKKNFAQAIIDHDYLLVMFYSPKCSYSRRLIPNFDTAATILEDEKFPIKLGKVDCLDNVDLRKIHRIKKYPTLKLFRRGDPPLQYQGKLSTFELAPHDIIDWVEENIQTD